jgi:hypothetical protein
MKHKKRLQALETKMLSNPVILHFADGSTKQIHGSRHFLIDLLARASQRDLTPHQAAQFELILEAVWAEEPGGGHMCEVLQAVFGGGNGRVNDVADESDHVIPQL